MNELKIFEGQNVEIINVKGEVLFNAKDVAKILDIKNVRDNLRTMTDKQCILLKNSAVGETDTRKLNNAGENFLTEAGVYKLAFRSNKPNAERFTEWVTSDVLPAIRREGIYMTDKKAHDLITNKESFADLLELASKQLREKDIIIQELQPKALFADSVTNSHTSILVGELAKILKQNGIDMGANRLFKWLRENKYLISRKGTDYNMPTQYSMERGLFEIKEGAYTNPDGSIAITKTPKVTGKGQVYFINKFLN